jgi:RNA ligase
MTFPIINNINDILPHIEGHLNFYVKEKEEYTYIDYILNTPDMFNNPYQKECRGILFYKNGDIMARRLHKFFNLNERPESTIDKINLQGGEWKILEKLDGSLITPMLLGPRLSWGSKAGQTFLTPQIEEFVSHNPNYISFVNKIYPEYTPIFEWCSNKNRIVISYTEDRLVLTAIRHTITGEYIQYETMCNWANSYNIDIVKQFPIFEKNAQQLAEETKKLKGVEGFVLRNKEGQMIKLKAEEYCIFHRTKEDIRYEKNLVKIIINNVLDDIKPLIVSDYIAKINKFEKEFWYNFNNSRDEIFNLMLLYNSKTTNRKDFSINVVPNLKPFYKKFVYNFFDLDIDNSSLHQLLTSYLIIFIDKKLSSKLDEIKFLWDGNGSLKWE